MEYNLEKLSGMPLYGDDWTEANQSRLYAWKRECIQLLERHHKLMVQQKARYVLLKSCALTCSVLTAALLAFNERYPAAYLSDIAIGTSAIVSLMSGIDFLTSPQEKYVGHKQAKSAYGNIVRTVDYFCSLPLKKRPDVEVAYVIVTGEMNNIETTSPPAPLIREGTDRFPDLVVSREEQST